MGRAPGTDQHQLLASAAACLGQPAGGLALDRVDELTPGLSGARVFRASARAGRRHGGGGRWS